MPSLRSWGLAGLAALAGCSVDLRETCADHADCPADRRCVDTSCVAPDAGARPLRDATHEEDARASDAAPPADARVRDGSVVPDARADAAERDAAPMGDAAPVADAAPPADAASPTDAAPPPDALPPDLGPPPCVPHDEAPRGFVINEIDYDMPGAGEDEEFIELRNGSCGPLSLRGWRLQLVNGDANVQQRVYLEVDLERAAPLLAPGGYLVVTDPQVQTGPEVVRVHLPPAPGSQIQGGPADGAVLVDPDGRVVDSLVYEGRVFGYGEGDGAAGDLDANLRYGIGRCPDGRDTDDNAADFRPGPATPGRPNDCPPD